MDSARLHRLARLSALLLACAGAVGARSEAAPFRPLPEPRAALEQDGDAEVEELLAEERAEADRLRRRGELGAAERMLAEHLAEDPEDGRSRLGLARCRFDQDRTADAAREAERALDAAEANGAAEGGVDRALFAAAARELVRCELELGHVERALAVIDRAGGALEPATDPRSAFEVGRALREAGRRDEAREAFLAGSRAADAPAGDPAVMGASWELLLARARCERALGWHERAARSLVLGLGAARAEEGGPEPDLLAELGWLYHEVYRETSGPVATQRSAAVQFRDALALHPTHLDAQLGELELFRYNWRRMSRSAADVHADVLAAHPNAVRARLAGASAALDDGQLVAARAHLERLRELAPERRDVRTEEAALAWIEHRRDEARAMLAELAAGDAADGRPEREVGRHLCELYRFGEAHPFLAASVERDPSDPDAWTQLGRALANSGDEESALAALRRAEEVAAGRQDAWRKNTLLALERMARDCTVETRGELAFVWRADEAAVLDAYLPDFYSAAREDLSRRYGFTPGPVRIEIFRAHADFSARSTGFDGFPATGVCFGPVVTALSPLSELRGSFSWARTSFHEFSHVVHLGLSHNRCPRWITEGLATWEEEHRDPAWTRNMRRDLLDAYENGNIIPVRELNAAFRGPRILFGYYQGGLLCEMLIAEHGFSPLVRLLEAFDRGLDLDQAFGEVFGATPEDVDRRFQAFVEHEVRGLALEPRWDPRRASALRLSLGSQPPPPSPDDPPGADTPGARLSARERWREDWVTVAFAAWQSQNRVDAEQALRTAAQAGASARAHFLRGEMAMSRQDVDAAVQHWEDGLAAGGEDFRVRIALGSLAAARGARGSAGREGDEALAHFLAAERAFPGFAEAELAAEKKLVALYESRGEEELAMQARERWLAWDSSDLGYRIAVAAWHEREGRLDASAERYREANEIDPFRRSLHRRWGAVLAQAGRHGEAEREFAVALAVPVQLDADVVELAGAPIAPEAYARARAALLDRDLAAPALERELELALGLAPEAVAERTSERALLLGLRAAALLELGRGDEARSLAREATEIDPDCEPAARVLERLQ